MPRVCPECSQSVSRVCSDKVPETPNLLTPVTLVTLVTLVALVTLVPRYLEHMGEVTVCLWGLNPSKGVQKCRKNK